MIRRLIRHTQTKKYFCSGDWVDDAKDATEFSSTPDVQEAKRRYGLTDIELVYQFPFMHGQEDVAVSIE